MENRNEPAPHHTSERAFEQIHKANQFIRVITVLALAVMVGLLTFTVIRVNDIQQQYQGGAIERSKASRELLEGLTESSRETQVLICNIITVLVPEDKAPAETVAQITKICGPVLANPDGVEPSAESEQQSFLAPGSNKVANNSSDQPSPQIPDTTKQRTETPASEPAQPTPTPEPNTPPAEQPGPVKQLTDATAELLCTLQQTLLNRCIIGN